MDNRKEQVFTDLGALCRPQEHISELRELYKWASVTYETTRYKGSMLSALRNARPQDVMLDPKLEGYYKIFVGMPDSGNRLRLRLSGEQEFMSISSGRRWGGIEDAYWRVADMTGQSVVISKYASGQDRNAAIAWLRFVPMDDAEVAAWRANMEQRGTKRIYATDDTHNRLCGYCPDTIVEWREMVKDYEDSDVEWLSLENSFIYDSDCSTGDVRNFAFCRECDYHVQTRKNIYYTKEMMADMMRFGKKQGLKMCISMRMGAWGMEFPYDQEYYVSQFHISHLNQRCVDRDGAVIDALSYSFPEVRQFVIDQFLQMAALGADAVEMMFCRGIPYVLFEQPVIDRFQREYGMDPRTLPLDDPRLNAVHCAIMTEFIQELRAALDIRFGKNKVGLHARVLFSLYDSRYVGLDVADWAKKGLISCIISYPRRIRERLEGDVWQDAPGGLIDLEKYTKYVRESESLPILLQGDFNYLEPLPDTRGQLRGPASQQERVAEFMALEKEYGTRVYFEILPRQMATTDYVARAMELYNAGANGISLWDTFDRVSSRSVWSMIRRLGHKDELPGYGSGEGEFYTHYRYLKLNGLDVGRYEPGWGG